LQIRITPTWPTKLAPVLAAAGTDIPCREHDGQAKQL
jgi:hypothetical protein